MGSQRGHLRRRVIIVTRRTMGDGSGPSGGLAPAGYVSPRGEGVVTSYAWKDEAGVVGWCGGAPPVKIGRWYDAPVAGE